MYLCTDRYISLQVIEFVVEDGALYLIKCSPISLHTALAGVRICANFVHSGLLRPAEALQRIDRNMVRYFTKPVVDPLFGEYESSVRRQQ